MNKKILSLLILLILILGILAYFILYKKDYNNQNEDTETKKMLLLNSQKYLYEKDIDKLWSSYYISESFKDKDKRSAGDLTDYDERGYYFTYALPYLLSQVPDKKVIGLEVINETKVNDDILVFFKVFFENTTETSEDFEFLTYVDNSWKVNPEPSVFGFEVNREVTCVWGLPLLSGLSEDEDVYVCFRF
ncbi:MAG: hypothetical protein AABX84_03080 [Nanoarchaeota archaeon]